MHAYKKHVKNFCKTTTALISVNGHKVRVDIYGIFHLSFPYFP